MVIAAFALAAFVLWLTVVAMIDAAWDAAQDSED